MAVERLHDDLAMLGAKALDRRAVARDQRRRHEIGELHHEDFFRRVAHMRGVVDDERARREPLQKMRGGNIGEIEGRVLAQQHHVHGAEFELGGLAERVIAARIVENVDRRARAVSRSPSSDS